MEGEIDFDPLTAEGREDINDTVDEEYESLLQQEDETPRGWYERIRTKFGSNTKFAISRVRDLFKTRNPRSSIPVYLQMKEDYQTDYRTPQYEIISEITLNLKEKRPNVDLSRLEFKVNEKGRAMVKYTTGKKWYYIYNSKTGDILKYLPKNIQDALGDPPLRKQMEVIDEREELEMEELKEAREYAISDAVASDDPELRFAGNYIRDLVALKKDNKNQVLRLLKKVIEINFDETKDATEELMRKFTDQLEKMSKESKRKAMVFFKLTQSKSEETTEKTHDKYKILIEASKNLTDGLAKLSKESKQKLLTFMKNIERVGGEEEKEVIIEEMNNFYDEMQEEIDRLKEELQDSRNFNINRMTQPEWVNKIRELEEEIEKKDAEVEVLKESMDEAEKLYVKQNEELIKAQKLESLVSQERIKTLIEDRNDAREDYYKLKERFNNIKENLDSIKKSFKDELQKHKVNLDRLKETEDALNKTREEKGELQRQVIVKEQQLRDMEQAIKELEEEIERQREEVIDQTKTKEEIEAAQRELESLQEKITELESKKGQLERELGLTRREKIKRLLQKAGMGVMLAGAIAGIVSLIINIINPVGKGLRKVGNEAGKQFKKLGDESGKEFKKLGKQLTDTGKKLAASIPGLLGSVLSLILKTGGELLKFLGNNIWILVVALGAVILKSLTEKSSRR